MNLNGEYLSNGLYASIDWLSFTTSYFEIPNDVIEFLGFTPSDFVEAPFGANGYKHMLRLSGSDLSILYDGRENMGIHVNISGSSIFKLLTAYRDKLAIETPFGEIAYEIWGSVVMADFLKAVLSIGHLTRLDLAIDDFGCNFYSLSELAEKINNKEYVSLWRTHEFLIKKNVDSIEGYTIYFGSRQSDIRLRIYDKKLEQSAQYESNDKKLVQEWTRWELQLRNDRATECARLLALDTSIGSVAVGILSYYLRFVYLDDLNRSRCTTENKWNEFIDSIGKLSLYLRPTEKTLDDMILWIEKQIAPTLAALYVARGGSIDFLVDIVERNVVRVSPSCRERVKEVNPIAYEKWFGDEVLHDS